MDKSICSPYQTAPLTGEHLLAQELGYIMRTAPIKWRSKLIQIFTLQHTSHSRKAANLVHGIFQGLP
ncbi:hypothetical protein [Paremcibacter congregatus]|uniref:Uncharacterized protein n=1 Tax=Paremcibacter congregatus TaxID=2043170 RepID=A0A2G4YXI4_9PROT|nr:hypothetical protein [Paremcibacter congregatus]PHZ86146.1 hypothetical protein CRD36_05605 [Paremcibacter congregatus]QDE27111.1 hypothetical protein FIV45_07375 [Paremcibacter congregatus]